MESIIRFSQLSSGENKDCKLIQRYITKTGEILKILRPIVVAVVDAEVVASYEQLQKTLIVTSQFLDELGEILENWQPLMSKFYMVLQVESLITKIEAVSLEVFELLESHEPCFSLEDNVASLEHAVQKMKLIQSEQISEIITKAISEQFESSGASLDVLEKIADCLSLKSNQELLIEVVALEKLKERAEQGEDISDVDYIDDLISLVTYMHEQFVIQNRSHGPVTIPIDFCCPLSLELMRDPVIVSSGQTYDREFIQEWFDLGLDACPKTRQPLANTNLVPNYIVKGFIAGWCFSNNVKLPEPIKSKSLNQSDHSSDDPSMSLDLANDSSSPVASSGSPTEHQSASKETLSEMAEKNINSSGIRSQSNEIVDLNNQQREPEQPYGPDTRTRVPFWVKPSNRIVPRIVSYSATETASAFPEVEVQVKKLIEELTSPSLDSQRNACGELRVLARHSTENRIVIANCGAIAPLVNLLRSTDKQIQEIAVTALLNLSINDNNKIVIANGDAIELLMHVLQTGTHEAKENSAATLFSLSAVEGNKAKIGRSGAIKPLVDLLGNGTLRGKKDAATALFNLSILNENKTRIVEAGAVKYLVDLMDPAVGMVDKAVAVLSNLATIPEGKQAIGTEEGIPVLVEVVELGSARGKENAAAALLQLCTSSNLFCNMVLQEGAVPPLKALLHSGTSRAKEKAHQLLTYFRSRQNANANRR